MVQEKNNSNDIKNRNGSHQTITVNSPLTLTDSNFDQTLNLYPLLIVDFWAPHRPCEMFEPVIEQLASEMANKAMFGRLNTDENPKISNSLGINNIPTVLIFKNGKVVDGYNGLMLKTHLQLKIQAHCNLDE